MRALRELGRALDPTIDFHLLVDQADDFIDRLVTWHSKVLWRLIIGSDHSF